MKKKKESILNSEDKRLADGSIVYENFSIRYNSKIALKRINLNIKSGEKVLICGRTGSGKTTLATSIFNIREKDTIKGDIKIGGHSIFNISLKSLRSQLTIIPQQISVFNDTLRFNLDPTGEIDDEILWESLANADLYEYFANQNKKLDTICSDKNLSRGQMQLICLARASLRKSKIVVLDESSSSLDELTSKKINNYDFSKGTTILAVAHRIFSFLHFDRVIVLEKGNLVQDEPLQEAVRNVGSPFYKMHMEESKKINSV
ncbi:MAG: hypothetical protein MHPSP_001607 [Paramarteilia canceri]